MSISRWMLVALAAAAIPIAGCGSDASSAAAPKPNACTNDTRAKPYSAGEKFEGSNGVVITLDDSDPAPPARGDNTWTLEISDSTGTAISDATVTVSQKMVDHGHGGAKIINVTSLGDGSYKAAPVNFNMSGYWENYFDVKTATVDDQVDVKICVP